MKGMILVDSMPNTSTDLIKMDQNEIRTRTTSG